MHVPLLAANSTPYQGQWKNGGCSPSLKWALPTTLHFLYQRAVLVYREEFKLKILVVMLQEGFLIGKNHEPFSALCSLKLIHLISCCTGLCGGAVC